MQKALWLLGELDLEYEHVLVGGAAGGLDEAEFLALNPHGRIPVLRDGDVTVWESHTVLRYVAARYGEGKLWSTDPAVRSQAERWMDWSQCDLQRDFMNLFWGFFRTPVAMRNARVIEEASMRCVKHFELLDGILARQPYLAGNAFTLGDMPAGTTLYRYFEMGVPVPDVPHVRAWYARLAERPAYHEHVMRPFEELRGRLAF